MSSNNFYASGMDYVGKGALGSYSSGRLKPLDSRFNEFERIFINPGNKGTYIGIKDNEGKCDIYTWGENLNGSLLGSKSMSESAIVYTPTKVRTVNSPIVKVTGNYSACFYLLANGELYMSGGGTIGSGVGYYPSNRDTFVKVSSIYGYTNIKVLDIHQTYKNGIISFVDLDTNMIKIATSGYNTYGQLACNNSCSGTHSGFVEVKTIGRYIEGDEVLVRTSDIVSLYAIKNTNELYVSGGNVFGNLGVGSDDTSLRYNTFKRIPIPSDHIIEDIGVTNGSSQYITTDGELYTWGAGYQSGIYPPPSSQKFTSPTKITSLDDYEYDLPKFKKFHGYECVDGSIFVETTDKKIFAWGSNTNNKLGVYHGFSTLYKPTYVTRVDNDNNIIVSLSENISILNSLMPKGHLSVTTNGYTTMYINLGTDAVPLTLKVSVNDNVIYSKEGDEETGIGRQHNIIVNPYTLNMGINSLKFESTYRNANSVTLIGEIEYNGIIFDHEQYDVVLIEEEIYNYFPHLVTENNDYSIRVPLAENLSPSVPIQGNILIPSIHGIKPKAKVFYKGKENLVEYVSGIITRERIIPNSDGTASKEHKIIFSGVEGNRFKLMIECSREDSEEDFAISRPMAAFEYFGE